MEVVLIFNIDLYGLFFLVFYVVVIGEERVKNED